jgi:hypothetical protein
MNIENVGRPSGRRNPGSFNRQDSEFAKTKQNIKNDLTQRRKGAEENAIKFSSLREIILTFSTNSKVFQKLNKSPSGSNFI